MWDTLLLVPSLMDARREPILTHWTVLTVSYPFLRNIFKTTSFCVPNWNIILDQNGRMNIRILDLLYLGLYYNEMYFACCNKVFDCYNWVENKQLSYLKCTGKLVVL